MTNSKTEATLVVHLGTLDKTEVEAFEREIRELGVDGIEVLGELRKTPTRVVRKRLLDFESSWKYSEKKIRCFRKVRHDWIYNRFEPIRREELWDCFDCGLHVA